MNRNKKLPILYLKAVVQRCSVKKVFLEISQNSLENTCARDSFLIKLQAEACNFIKKESLAQVFSCEFCEISKNTFFHRTPLVAASVYYLRKKLSKFSNAQRKVFHAISFQLCSTAYSKFSLNVSLREINCIKILTISLVLNTSILTSSFASY